LALVHHVAHMLWLVRPSVVWTISWTGAAGPAFVGLLWSAWFATALRGRPTFATEKGEAAPGT
jgi:hypothetical protein